MSVVRALGRTAGLGLRTLALLAGGGVRTSRYLGRGVLRVRRRGAGGETGMLRLLDLHAASCAGDTLVAIGLVGTIFFAVPAGDARGRVALYLLVTMVPFAILAPVVGPVLDRFRHGRRYALATTMLGRAFLAYMISEHVGGLTLYPAAFGILLLSRAYGVARSAAVPRLLPEGLGLSEAGARASLFGTVAGGLVVPVGLAASTFGSAWPLRISMLVFVYGMITALRLPPRADADPPEMVPRPLQAPGRKGVKVLTGQVVLTTLAGSATLRFLYGFLALYLAFAIRSGELGTRVFSWSLSPLQAIGAVAAALAVGSFAATAVGARLRIRRPATLQATAIVTVAIAALGAATAHSLAPVLLLCLVTAVASGLAKLAVDAVIQERIDERVRASAFAHSETALMLAWVAGGALGLIPFGGRWGFWIAAALIVAGAARAVIAAMAPRRRTRPPGPEEPAAPAPPAAHAEPPTRRMPAEVPVSPAPAGPAPVPRPPVETEEAPINSPGFHLYRPSGLGVTQPTDDPDDGTASR
ncbi:MAG TPA: MFS transporter [Micromonosporaceae bacterium]|nr:MFS transporter [Micromonosporaceae bacterium]